MNENELKLLFYIESILEMLNAIRVIQSKHTAQEEVNIEVSTRYLDEQCFSLLANSDVRNIITHLEFRSFCLIDVNLDHFENLRSFRGDEVRVVVSLDHSLQELALFNGVISNLSSNLNKLSLVDCKIVWRHPQPRLQQLRSLLVSNSPHCQGNCYSSLFCMTLFGDDILQDTLWNDELEELVVTDRESHRLGHMLKSSKLRRVGFFGSMTNDMSPELEEISIIGGEVINDLTKFTNLKALSIQWPLNKLDSMVFPPSLTKIYIRYAEERGVKKIVFPEGLLELTLADCALKHYDSTNLPKTLVKLSITDNDLTEFECDLPECTDMNLSGNELEAIRINTPKLISLNLNENLFSAFPRVSNTVKDLLVGSNEIDLSTLKDLPPALKTLTMYISAKGKLTNFTFPASLEEIDLSGDPLEISGINFPPDSKLKKLNLSMASLGVISDATIKLPQGLEWLDLYGNGLETIDDLLIPQSLKFLDLGNNRLESFNVPSSIQTLLISDNPFFSNLQVSADLDLRSLVLEEVGWKDFSFGMLNARKLEMLKLGPEVESLDVSEMPSTLQYLKYGGDFEHPDFVLQRSDEDGLPLYRRISSKIQR